MGENIYNSCSWQGTHIQKIQRTLTQQRKRLAIQLKNRREILQRRCTMAVKPMKRCSTSLVIREKRIEATMRSPFTPTRRTIMINKTENNKCWREYETLEPVRCWWKCKPGQLLWKQLGSFSKAKHRTAVRPQSSTLQHRPKGVESRALKRHSYANIYCRVFTIAKT